MAKEKRVGKKAEAENKQFFHLSLMVDVLLHAVRSLSTMSRYLVEMAEILKFEWLSHVVLMRLFPCDTDTTKKFINAPYLHQMQSQVTRSNLITNTGHHKI